MIRSRAGQRKWQVITVVVVVAVVLAGDLLPIFNFRSQAANYDLSAVSKLLSPTPKDLQDKLKYDSSKKAWLFNQDAAAQLPSSSADATKIGGLTYSAHLPVDLADSDGLNLTDTTSKLNILMKPDFALKDGKVEQGYAVYPLAGSKAQLIYTFKQDGVKEDIVLYNSPGDTAQFSYTLDLPVGLAARIQNDGSIGVFGGDPKLFGNISYGGEKDKVLVESARKNSTKNHLVYIIPAPTISGDGIDSVKAKFSLEGEKLTIHASGLNDANYPLSIDPSFIMNTTNCSWLTNGRNEGNTNLTGCQLARSNLSGGVVSSWANNTNNLFEATYAKGLVVSNGYMYALSGVANGGSGGTSVHYATINDSTGVVGSFSATTSMNTNHFTGGFAAVNGYIYAFGGDIGTNATNIVEVAKPNSDGTISNWNNTTSMNEARKNAAVTVYNGRIYAAGGCTANTCNIVNSVISNTTEYATIQADGTLSSWTSGSLPFRRYFSAMSAYDGKLYLQGGWDEAETNQSTTHYAPINSDGSIGTWTATSSSTVALAGHRTAALNGYLYIMGGSQQGPTTYESAVYVAKIYADGTLGPFKVTASMSSARVQLEVVTYNGRIYAGGGCTNICSGGSGNWLNTLDVATISTSLGTVSTYTTNANNLVTGVSAQSSTTVYNGYMYVVGGHDGTNPVATVQYAQINADGSIGTWNTTTALGLSRYGAAVTAYNGYLYVMGGQRSATSGTDCVDDGGSIYCKDVVYAQINSNGTLGSWSSGGQFSTTARAALGAVAQNGYLYVMGGVHNNNATLSSEVNYVQINSNGSLGTWNTSSNSLNNARSHYGVASNGKYIYLTGGRCSSCESTTSYGQIPSAGGDITSWADAGSNFTTGRQGLAAAISNNYIYIAGGGNGSQGTSNVYNDVQYASINANGTLGSWTTSTATVVDRIYSGSAAYNGFFYSVGGCSNPPLTGAGGSCNTGEALNTIEYAQIYNGGGGSTNSWTTQGATDSSARIQLAAAAYNDYVYVAGGCGGNLGAGPMGCTNLGMIGDIRYAAMTGNGTIGSWASAGANFSPARTGLVMVPSNGYMYVMGGCSAGSSGDCTTFQNDVQYALICTGNNNGVGGCGSTPGTVGTWNTTTSFSTGRYGLSGVAFNGYMYVMGGCSATAGGSCNTFQNDVQYALICTGNNNGVGGCGSTPGTVGTWSSAGSGFATGRLYQTATVNNNYLYVMGGCSAMSGVACTTFQSDVQYRQINVSNGTLTGSWTGAPSFGAGRFGAVAVAHNGYLYLTGGCTAMSGGNCSQTLDTTSYAPLFTNGTIGSWSGVAGRLANPRALHGAAVSKGHLTIFNGVQQTNSFVTTASTAGLISTPAIARHSMLLRTDARTLPANFFTTVTPQSGSSSINVSASSTNDPAVTLNHLGTNRQIMSSTKYQLIPGNDGTKYYWLQIVLDDTQSMTFGETAGSNMTYLQLNYHPNPGMRLRGGKTFNSNMQQSLDAR